MSRLAIVLGIMTLVTGVFAGEVSATAMSAKQRYPRNGLVDIVVTIIGDSNEVALAECVFTATNCATQAALPITHVTCVGTDPEKVGTDPEKWLRRYIWDAAADVGEVKIEAVKLAAKARKPLGGVQLWANGPYWAECNVGATKPEEYGYYFWWGDTEGYKRESGTWRENCDCYTEVIWVSSDGNLSSSPFDICPTTDKSNSELHTLGYIDSTGNLTAAHDAATVHLGSPWRMPTAAEFSALINNCTTTWITTNGVSGCLVTGEGAYASKSIFLPAAGGGSGSVFGRGSYLYISGSYGYYWSSTPHSDYSYYAWLLYFSSGYFARYYNYRYYGQSVRPLREFAK